MIAPQPQEKIVDLLDQISQLVDKRTGTSFTHLRLMREVGELRQHKTVDQVKCIFGLALLNYLEGNRERSIELFESAIKLEPGTVGLKLAYISALNDMGSLRESYSLAMKIANANHGDKAVLRGCIRVSFNALQLSGIPELLKLYDKLAVNDGVIALEKYREPLKPTMQIVEENNISEESLMCIVETAVSYLRSQKVEVRATASSVMRDGRVLYHLLVDDDYAGCAEKSFEVAMAICEAHEETYMEFLSVDCRPLSTHHLIPT